MSNEPIFMSLCFEQMPPDMYIEKVVDPGLPTGMYNSLFEFPESAGNFSSTGVTAHDQFTSVLDGDPAVMTYDNFTINAGHTVTTTNRCKGLYLNILGDLVVNGTLSMTARGAKTAGKYVIIEPNGKKIYYSDTLNGSFDYTRLTVINKLGGATSTIKNTAGNPGVNGACGGGGCGKTTMSGGLGGNGTSFSGGAGGGGLIGSEYYGPAKNGAADGGAGGGGISTEGTGFSGGGGAGNPGGRGWNGGAGANGTGGLMILFVQGNVIFGTNGSIQSNGSNGGSGTSPGGGSGGGAIHLFHKGTIAAPSKVRALGGIGGSNNTSCSGGNGTVNIVQI